MADLVNVAPGQCRLQVDSTSQISLQRHKGMFIPLKIAGVWEAKIIPSSGPTLANTGLTQATLYYIYVFDSSGTLALEASATGHSTDADTGVEIKTGDASRTLVGMVYMDTGSPGLFRNTTSKRWCLNWFNRRSLDLTGTFSADRSTNSTTFVEINTEIRMEFLTWADEAVQIMGAGTVSTSSGGNASHSGIGIDSTTVATADVGNTITATNQRNPWSVSVWKMLSEGYHFATLLGGVSGGTATWTTATAINIGTSKTFMWAQVRG